MPVFVRLTTEQAYLIAGVESRRALNLLRELYGVEWPRIEPGWRRVP